jgi:adenylosuccinate synthase
VAYVARLEAVLEVPLDAVSVGPERSAMAIA